MPDQPDHLSNEVSVEVSISEKVDGIAASARTKSRAVAALDRLLGGIVDVPAAYLDGKAAKIRARNAVETELIKEEGKAAIAARYNDPAFGARTAERIARDQARKQINREAVAVKMIEHLQEEGDDPGAPEGKLDNDWLNVFEAAAEKASSERLRDMWGKVLAGEIRKPGSYSLSTLRFISELDMKIAETFQKYAILLLPDGEVIKPKELKQPMLSDLLFLEEVGLLQQVTGSVVRSIPVDGHNVARYWIGDIFLHMKTNRKTLQLNVIRITRVGNEIASILPKSDPLETIKAVANYFLDECDEATIFRVVLRTSDGVHGTPIVKVK